MANTQGVGGKILSFLKKVETGLIKFLPQGDAILNIAQMLVPDKEKAVVSQVKDKFDQVATLAMTVGKAFDAAGLQGSGAQKLTALQAFTLDILKQSELVVAHGVADDTLFAKGANEISQGVVDILNSLKGQDGSTVAGTTTTV